MNELAGMLSDQSQRCHLFTTSDESLDKMRQNVVADSLLIAAITSTQEGNDSKEEGKHLSKTPAEHIDNIVMDFAHKLEAFRLEDPAAGKILQTFIFEINKINANNDYCNMFYTANA